MLHGGLHHDAPPRRVRLLGVSCVLRRRAWLSRLWRSSRRHAWLWLRQLRRSSWPWQQRRLLPSWLQRQRQLSPSPPWQLRLWRWCRSASLRPRDRGSAWCWACVCCCCSRCDSLGWVLGGCRSVTTPTQKGASTVPTLATSTPNGLQLRRTVVKAHRTTTGCEET